MTGGPTPDGRAAIGAANPCGSDPGGSDRCGSERGSAMVTALVLLFAFTAGAMIWLARDVDRTVSNRSIAASIAFQAARGGAQQVEVAALRGEAVVIDPVLAEREARRIAGRLFAEYGVEGTVAMSVDPRDQVVTVRIELVDPAGTVSGVGSARPQEGS